MNRLCCIFVDSDSETSINFLEERSPRGGGENMLKRQHGHQNFTRGRVYQPTL
jgi:hypothetical protein